MPGPGVSPEVRAVWDRLEKNLDCKGLCQESCGRWVCTPSEGAALEQAAGKPVTTQPMCPYLAGGACSVHAIRPTVCRMWGQVESMPCRFGCKPRRLIPDAEAFAMVDSLGISDWSPWADVERRHKHFEDDVHGADRAAP